MVREPSEIIKEFEDKIKIHVEEKEWSGKGVLSKENMERALRESDEVMMKVFNQNWMTRLLYRYAVWLGKDKS